MLAAFVAIAVKGGDTVVHALVDALNAKSRSELHRHFETRWDGARSPSHRADHFWPIVEQGAPFRVIRVAENSDSMCRALVQDKNDEKLALTITLRSGKATSLRLGHPDSLLAPAPKDLTGFSNAEDLARSIVNETLSPACAVAWSQGDRPAQLAVFGKRQVGSDETVKTGDRWLVGSIGKPMTATLIARLIERGKLGWSWTLRRCLPTAKMSVAFESVTIEQLLTHRSGLPQDMGFTALEVASIVGMERDPVKVRSLYVANVLSRPSESVPGSQFAYSNAGYAVLGHIAETIMGVPYERLMKTEVFEPIGMDGTQVGLPVAEARARGHRLTEKGPVPHELDGPIGLMLAPAGVVWCTIADLHAFGLAHLKGLAGDSKLLSRSTFERLHKGIAEGRGSSEYACGWVISSYDGTERYHGHNGSDGTFVAELAIFPKSRVVAASIVNRGGEDMPSPPEQAITAIARRFAPARH